MNQNDIPSGLEVVELTGKEAFDLLASAFDFAEVETVPMELEPTERSVWRDKIRAAGLGVQS
jgi:hypothetical protein